LLSTRPVLLISAREGSRYYPCRSNFFSFSDLVNSGAGPLESNPFVDVPAADRDVDAA